MLNFQYCTKNWFGGKSFPPLNINKGVSKNQKILLGMGSPCNSQELYVKHSECPGCRPSLPMPHPRAAMS